MDGFPGEISESVDGEDGFDDDGASEHEAELHGGERHHRDDGVAQRVLEEHDARSQALGARRADVVGREHLEHASPCQTHHRRCDVIAEGHRRHDEVLPGGGARDRQQTPFNAEPEDENQGKPEARQGLTDDCDAEGQAVNQGVGPDGRQHAQGDGQQQREAESTAPQDHGGGQPVEDDVGDGGFQIVGAAEIALHRSAQPIDVLHEKRAVVAVDPADILDIVLGGRFAGERHGGIARQVEQREGHHGDGDGDQDRNPQPLERVVQHAVMRPKNPLTRRAFSSAPGRGWLSHPYFHFAV